MTKTEMRLFGLLIALSLIACDRIIAQAQTTTTGRIRGQVREERARPGQDGVAGATVTFSNPTTGIDAYQIETDSNGDYQIGNVRPGDYTITASRRGYVSTPQSTVKVFRVHVSDYNILRPPPLVLRKAGVTQLAPGDEPKSELTLASVQSLTFDSAFEKNGFDEVSPRSYSVLSPEAPKPAEKNSTFPVAPPQPAPAQVAEAEQLVNTANATRSGNFSDWQLQSLPLPGTRSFDQLAFLMPGVAPPPQTLSRTVGPGIGSGVGTSGQFAVNGLRSRANNFTVDGSDNNDEDIGVRRQGFTSLLPQSIESLQEFYIATLLPPSQFGRNLGAQVNAVSRPGESNYHGTLYSFLTDRRLNARNFFDLTEGPAEGEDRFTRSQSGFVVGGPIVKLRTHFFGSVEHQAIKARKESHFAAPTIAERGLFKSGAGDFSDMRFKTRKPGFPTTSGGDAFFSLYPRPNNPGGPYGENTVTQALPADARGDVFSIKVDHKLRVLRGDHILTGRYNFTDDNTILPVAGEALFSSLRALVRAQNISLFANSVFSNRASNELRFSYGRTRLRFNEVRHPFLQESKAAPEGQRGFLLNANLIVNKTVDGGPPVFEEPGFDSESAGVAIGLAGSGTGPLGQLIISGYSPVGVDVFHFPQDRANNTFQTADTFFYNLFRQTITAGFDLRRTQLNSRLDRNFRSLAVFSSVPDIALTPRGFGPGSTCSFLNPTQDLKECILTGADLAAIGAPTGFYQTHAMFPDSTIGLRYWQTDLFLTDEIQLHRRLRLTLGIKYALNTVPREVNRRIESTFTSPDVIEFQTKEREATGTSGLAQFLAGRESIFQPDRNNIAPHVALAWDPFGDGKTAIRAGFGIYYDQIPGAVITQSRNVFPNFVTLNFAGLGLSRNIPLPTGGSRQIDFFAAFNPASMGKTQNGVRSLNTLSVGNLRAAFGGRDLVESLLGLEQLTNFAGGPGFILPAADLETPSSQHWGLTIERELKRDYFFSLAYVGTRGIQLLRFATPNLGPNAIPVVDNLQTGSDSSAKSLLFQGRTFSPLYQGQPLRRFPLLGSFTSIESDAGSTYHSFQAQFNRRLSRGLQFTTAYTWSHAIDEVSDLFDLAGGSALPQNSFDRWTERASANFDIRHRFVTSVIWDFPDLAQRKYLGGWQIAAIGSFQTGQPFTIHACCDVNLDGNATDRLQTTEGIRQVDDRRDRTKRFEVLVAQLSLQAQLGRNGAVGRNTFRAPGIASIDLALSKRFRFSADQQMTLRAEAFNLFNRTHFGMPVHQLLFPSLGRSVDTQLPARIIQFALKYSF